MYRQVWFHQDWRRNIDLFFGNNRLEFNYLFFLSLTSAATGIFRVSW
jgi:hypothetical protein